MNTQTIYLSELKTFTKTPTPFELFQRFRLIADAYKILMNIFNIETKLIIKFLLSMHNTVLKLKV